MREDLRQNSRISGFQPNVRRAPWILNHISCITKLKRFHAMALEIRLCGFENLATAEEAIAHVAPDSNGFARRA